MWVEPLWFFNLDKIDWETYTFSEYEIICDYLFSGIGEVTAPSDAPVKAVYTLTGQRVSASALTPGVYVVTRADGTAAKLFVK